MFSRKSCPDLVFPNLVLDGGRGQRAWDNFRKRGNALVD